MSETATICSSSSGGRPGLDLADTVPFTRLPNIRLTASVSTTAHESFLLRDRFIYSTSTMPAAAVYHVSTRNTRSGKPWQLAISHLLPSEARRLSTTAPPSAVPFIKYDDDLTLYTGEKLAVPISIGQKPLLCIRGGALPGVIVVEKTLGRSRTYKFWHMTPIRRPLTRAEEERMQALMRRRGYRTSDDWRRELLYAVQGRGSREAGEMDWTDERGVVVARETEGRQLVVAGGQALEASTRDLLVACWASRNFVQSTPETEATAA
ncbi:hypothetical protein LMH87_001819 [Akanthomyces muscarius]|uniref:Uncharacterized protein n=1 Tax=Akanthomyces muscarius TaxID=2231603 RepID=A0A9W8Q534_AKAMU|nr:hypothetical protein LMH87_001819 [Akanthomyces muscarius]KAJ4147285.1 hypothetical protein LMH87_001819 [Akanthomyces muscarius]